MQTITCDRCGATDAPGKTYRVRVHERDKNGTLYAGPTYAADLCQKCKNQLLAFLTAEGAADNDK